MYVCLLLQAGDAVGVERLLRGTLAALRSGGGGGASSSAQPAARWCLESLLELQLRQGALTDAIDTYKLLAPASGPLPASTATVS
jgi:hypothetical protein